MRYSAADRWADWAAAHRTNNPLVWVHGASVGELKAANPVMRRVRSAVRTAQVIYTHTSPSVEPWWCTFPADHTDYLPLDDTVTMSRVFEALRPSLIVVCRGDLWPGVVAAAAENTVPVGVIGGEISPSSSRLEWPWRSVFRGMYDGIAFVCASTAEDARRFVTVGAVPDVVVECGDPRADEVAEQTIGHIPTPVRPGECRLVAGSVEPEEESIVLEAFQRVSGEADVSLAVVPHDPDPAVPRRLSKLADRIGISDYSERVEVVNETGVLFDTYFAGDLAFVGGGFRKKGLHSVIEPAILGLPVLAGPDWSAQPVAARLQDAGALLALDELRPAESLAQHWMRLAPDNELRRHLGLCGRKAIGTGAAKRTAEVLIRHLRI